MFEIPADGRRYRALELLIKQKRLARTAPIPRVISTDGIAEEDTLAENIRRALLPALAVSAMMTSRPRTGEVTRNFCHGTRKQAR